MLSAAPLLLLLVQQSYALYSGEGDIRERRNFIPSNYQQSYYFYTPLIPVRDFNTQPQFYVRNQIPFSRTSNTYYNFPYGYRYQSFRNDTRSTIRRYGKKAGNRIKIHSKTFNAAVKGSKRSFKQDMKFKTKNESSFNHNLSARKESHAEIAEMISIPFKTSNVHKKRFRNKSIVLLNSKTAYRNGEKRVSSKNKTLNHNLNVGFIVPPETSTQKSLKPTIINHTTVVSDIVDEISSDNVKTKSVSVAYDKITNQQKIIEHNKQNTFKRNKTISHQTQNNATIVHLRSSNKQYDTPVKSANRTDNAQTKEDLYKNIKNGLQKAWKGVQNFTSYLTGPDKNKQKEEQSKKPQLWNPPNIKHDAAKEDWFGVEVEPDSRTSNDLKISKNKFFTELVKTKMIGKPTRLKSKDDKKNSENHVKKLVDLVEASEHEELKNLVQDSVGSPLKGELKRIPLSKENLKSVNKEKNAYIGAAESNEINKLISNYKDDFDVFVDKSINKETDADSTQAKGEVLTDQTKFADTDIQFDKISFPDSLNEDVTGMKKNAFNNSSDDDIPVDEVLSQPDKMSSLAGKWQLIKEANQQIFDEERKNLDDSEDSKNTISNAPHGSNVLDQYFSQVQDQENIDHSKKFENRQINRRQKINATLTMLSDIEHQIDGIIKDKGNSEGTYVKTFQGMPMKAKQKGRETIFQELVNGDGNKQSMGADENAGNTERISVMEEERNFVKPEEEQETQYGDDIPNKGELSAEYGNVVKNPQPFPKNELLQKQIGQQTESTNGNSEGKVIDSAVKNSDNVDRLLQAKALQNIQAFEMNNDLQRMKEVTQSGLREMFGTAVNKQQMFIDEMQGRNTPKSVDENSMEGKQMEGSPLEGNPLGENPLEENSLVGNPSGNEMVGNEAMANLMEGNSMESFSPQLQLMSSNKFQIPELVNRETATDENRGARDLLSPQDETILNNSNNNYYAANGLTQNDEEVDNDNTSGEE